MNKDIERLDPQIVWRHFAAICDIPHPSYNEGGLRDYVVDFARRHGLEHSVDAAGNVIVRKPAVPGMEGRRGVILQAHLDMVPQKNADKQFDFDRDPIPAHIDGGWVTADGTTLGADNGIGIAAILAALEDTDLRHGPLEGLFTASEEVGLDGAFGLAPGELRGGILLNLDSESEGELFVGCAGGMDVKSTFRYTDEAVPASGYKAIKISISGLRGGHSGLEIVLQRANANKLLFRFLRQAMKRYDLRLARVDGGGLNNAIPREAVAVVVVPERDASAVMSDIAEYEKLIVGEYAGREDGISIKAAVVALPAAAIDKKTAVRLADAVCGCPNGVIAMSMDMPGLVQTSSSLARVVSGDGGILVQCLLRSSVASEKNNLAGDISAVFELAGAVPEKSGSYDGWNPDMSSPVLKEMTAGYDRLFGRKPVVAAIHAGLECGIIGGKYPGLDMISFGPTIKYPHSPDEKVEIASVAKFWTLLRDTIEHAPEK